MDPSLFSTGFLSYARQGLSADSVAQSLSCKLIIDEVQKGTLTQHQVDKEFSLLGPGNIVGISEKMIAGVYPAANSVDFMCDQFPLIEFRDADFLWRYVYEAPENGKLVPWLSLLVFKNDEFELSEGKLSDNNPYIMKRLKLKDGLINFDDIKQTLWAMSHVQITNYSEDQKNNLKSTLYGEETENILCRLICPILLEKNTAYSAFVIPINNTDNSSWHLNNRDISEVGYPVYYTWSFSTCEKMDVESLFNRIKETKLINSILYISGPKQINFSKEPTTEGTEFQIQGALFPINEKMNNETISEELAKNLYYKYLESYKIFQGCPVCKKIFDGSTAEMVCNGTLENAHAATNLIDLDPYIGYPIYGGFHSNGILKPEELTKDKNGNIVNTPWMYDLNIAAKSRIAAGLGAEVIQKNQDEFVDYCWKNIKKLKAEDEEFQKKQVGKLLNLGIALKHFIQIQNNPSTNANNMLIARSYPIFEDQDEASKNISTTALSLGVLSYASRKIMHQKITARKKISVFCDTKISEFLNRRLIDDIYKNKPDPTSQDKPARIYSFTTNAKINSSLIFLRDNYRNNLNLKLSTTQITRSTSAKDITEFKGIPYPMYTFLSQLSFDYFIPNYSSLKQNKIVMLESNFNFIESYMVGLNHEMMRELIWREFPIHTNKTLFHYFWDRNGATTQDIDEIFDWNKNAMLGTNMNTQLGGKPIKSVVVIKADLIKYYHDLIFRIVSINDQNQNTYENWNTFFNDGYSPIKEHSILFNCSISEDAILFGLPLDENELNSTYFIISEQPSLPRFGLPEGEYVQGTINYNKLARGHFNTLAIGKNDWISPKVGLKNNIILIDDDNKPVDFWKSSATTAKCLLQKSVQVIIPFSKFLSNTI